MANDKNGKVNEAIEMLRNHASKDLLDAIIQEVKSNEAWEINHRGTKEAQLAYIEKVGMNPGALFALFAHLITDRDRHYPYA